MTPSKPSTFARLYQAQYAQHDDDLAFWLNLAADYGDPILELGCGSGRVLLPLARAGHQIAGLDNDPEMLALIRKSLTQPVSLRSSLHLLDMTRFEFGHPFSLIIVPCNTFSYLDDAEANACLRECRRHLLPGHPLALDLPNPHLLVEEPPDPDIPLMEFIEPESGNAVQLSATQNRLGTNRVHVTWQFDELLPDGTSQRHNYPQVYHLRSAREMVRLFSANGFSPVEVFGDYDRSPLESDSHRMLIVGVADENTDPG